MTKKIPTECYTQTHKPQIQSEAKKKEKKKRASDIYEHPHLAQIKCTHNHR
jgi:hypothetical protein